MCTFVLFQNHTHETQCAFVFQHRMPTLSERHSNTAQRPIWVIYSHIGLCVVAVVRVGPRGRDLFDPSTSRLLKFDSNVYNQYLFLTCVITILFFSFIFLTICKRNSCPNTNSRRLCSTRNTTDTYHINLIKAGCSSC